MRHHRRVAADSPPPSTDVCPGCGSVLARAADGQSGRAGQGGRGGQGGHPGASASCARLFEVTLRGLREETADAGSAAVVRLADAAYDAQHPVPGDPDRLRGALAVLAGAVGAEAAADPAPGAPRPVWRTTVADVAADLDVIDLAVLVEAWARSVHEDWAAVADDPAATRR